MDSKKQEESKKFSIKRFFNSIKYSYDGLKYAYCNEQSLLLHAVGSVIVILLAIIFRITFVRWAVLIISIVIVMVIELLNTAIEATVDLVTDKFHPLAKIAKDCGSAAGGVAGVMMFIIALIIFMPYFIELFS